MQTAPRFSNWVVLGLRLLVPTDRADYLASEFRNRKPTSRVLAELWGDIAHRLDTRFIFHPNVLGILLLVMAILPGFVGQPGDAAPPPWLPDAQRLAGAILGFTGLLLIAKFLHRKAWLSGLILVLIAAQIVVVFLAYRIYFIIFRVELLAASLLLPVLVAFITCKPRRYLLGEPEQRRKMPKVTIPVDPLKPMELLVIQAVMDLGGEAADLQIHKRIGEMEGKTVHLRAVSRAIGRLARRNLVRVSPEPTRVCQVLPRGEHALYEHDRAPAWWDMNPDIMKPHAKAFTIRRRIWLGVFGWSANIVVLSVMAGSTGGYLSGLGVGVGLTVSLVYACGHAWGNPAPLRPRGVPPRHLIYTLQRMQYLLDMFWRYDGPMFLLFITAPTIALHIQSLFHPPTLFEADIWGPLEWTLVASSIWFPILRIMAKRAIKVIDVEVQALQAAMSNASR